MVNALAGTARSAPLNLALITWLISAISLEEAIVITNSALTAALEVNDNVSLSPVSK